MAVSASGYMSVIIDFTGLVAARGKADPRTHGPRLPEVGSSRVFRRGCKVLHRLQLPVRTMCRLLRVHPSGFYTWLKNPLSRRANEDKRQTDLLLKAWEESGKVYGYRKLQTTFSNRENRMTRFFLGVNLDI